MVLDEVKSIMKVINITLDLVIVIGIEIRNKDIKIRMVAATPFFKNMHTHTYTQHVHVHQIFISDFLFLFPTHHVELLNENW